MAIWSRKSETEAPPAAPAQAAAADGEATAAGAVAPAQEELSEQARRQAAALSKAVMATFGQITTVLMRTPEYKSHTLADLEWLVVPAVLTGQFSLAEAQSKTNGMMAPVGLVMWAAVSPDVDRRLRENLQGPMRLTPQEWRSGDILWVIDAVGDPRILQAMLQNTANKEWKGRNVNLRVRGQDGAVRVGTLTTQKPDAPAA